MKVMTKSALICIGLLCIVVTSLVALSQDGVLLFTRDRRRRSSRALPRGAQRGRPSAATRAGR